MAVANPAHDSPRTEELALAGWSLCWASAMLFSGTAHPGWYSSVLRGTDPSDLASGPVVALALYAIIRAPSVWSLGWLAVAELVQVGVDLPEVPNHRLIVALVNLALLVAIFLRPTAGGILDAAIPPTRAVAVLLYGFASFAKLNRDFLDPSVSCAAQFYAHVTAWWPLLPGGPQIAKGIVVATIAAEGILALALCSRRLRPLAVVGGLLFHIGLALDASKSFLNFSSVMFALLLLFLPREFLASLGAATGRRGGVRLELAVGFLAIVATGFAAAVDWETFAGVFYWVRQIVWSTYALAILLFTSGWCLFGRGRERRILYRRLAPVAVVSLAAVNGLAPYLGLKTRTTFDMYSNLRLEADSSNHLLVPRSLDVLGILRDRVVILDTNDPTLRIYVQTGEEIPYWQLRASFTSRPSSRARFRRGGVEQEYDPERDHGTIEAVPWWQMKLMVFRPLGPQSRGNCLW